MAKLTVDRTISFGHLLTSVSIMISIVALLYGWSKDIGQRRVEQADEIRNAAAQALAKVQRWEELSLSLFEEIQPTLVATTELVRDEGGEKAGDYLWREWYASRQRMRFRILEEEIETAYVGLYGYHPEVRQLFVTARDSLQKKEEAMFYGVTVRTDSIVRNAKSGPNFQTAALGNKLRQVVGRYQERYEEQLDHEFHCLEDFLIGLVDTSDEDLINRRTKPTPCEPVAAD